MRSQSRHKVSQARASPRGGQATSQKKQIKQQKQLSLPTQPSATTVSVTQNLPVELQQAILNVFTQAFPVITQSDVFKRLMQEVKGHLYNRDFVTAFGKPEYLDVYASRWSAARALAYADIFTDPDRRTWFQPTSSSQVSSSKREVSTSHGETKVVVPIEERYDPEHSAGVHKRVNVADPVESLKPLSSLDRSSSVPTGKSGDDSPRLGRATLGSNSPKESFKIVVLGGGAGAEIAALAATWRCLQSQRNADNSPTHEARRQPPDLRILAVDIADWSQPVIKLSSALTTPAALPSYASQAVRDASHALISPESGSSVIITFSHQDVLQAPLSFLQASLSDVSLVTIMFTLNELFTTSLPKTTALLLNLTQSIEPGAHLVVVDSPGSYSEIKLGKPSASGSQATDAQTVKKYPMKWLLDHTLLEVAGKGEDAKWAKVEDEESKWFRIDAKLGLRYGVELENCRYQIHVYRKLE